MLYAFNVESGQLDSVLQAADREIIAIAHHPQRNLIATVNDDGVLKRHPNRVDATSE